MDPYYQQQQQAQQQQGGPLPVSSRGGMVDAGMVAASAPPLQSQQHLPAGQMGHHQQPQLGPQHQSSGHRSAGYSAGHQQAPAGSSAGSHHHSQQQQQAYVEAAGQAGYPAGSGRHSHHGGQAPLPPNLSGHHSASGGHRLDSGRYSGSHRQAVMHQHRSSAAAISDPMMASTITEHLASASGPMTGSGLALNQLGYYYPQAEMGGLASAVAPAGSGHHQSRYESHLSRRQQQQLQMQQQAGSNSAYPPGTTTAGAYHLDRSEGLFAPEAVGRYYPPAGPTNPPAIHQSLGNLPSATGSRLDRYGQLQEMSGYGGQAPLDRYYPAEGRAGSMPPMGLLEGPAAGQPVGLGNYNPLDETATLAGTQHLGPLARDGVQFGPIPYGGTGNSRDLYLTELRARLQEAQNSYAAVKRELETATQKLGSSMHSIKSFWSPELKKERALRKEEATKYALINDQMKLMRVEVQKQALLIRQLEEELRLAHETKIRTTDPDIQQHIDALCLDKEALIKENCLFRETIRELEMRLETQKQTLAIREDSIKKMVEMMNNKGIATKIMEDERMEMDRIKTRNIELEARLRHYETIIEAKEKDIIKPHPKENPSASASHFKAAEGKPAMQRIKSGPPAIQQKAPAGEPSLPPKHPLKSKVERLKSRLTQSRAASGHSELAPVSRSNSSASSASSSGVSSSRSSEILLAQPAESGGEVSKERKGSSSSEHYKLPMSLADRCWSERRSEQEEELKLCECGDCQASGLMIYHSNSGSLNRLSGRLESSILKQPGKAADPPTPPKVAPRKAVSFRSNVEHIGAQPSLRPLKGEPAGGERWPPLEAILKQVCNNPNDSCDSLHVTKDMSAANDDYLRPLDCSTPKRSLQPEASGGELLRVEVHREPEPPTSGQPDYTCLCAPDINCVHNLTSASSFDNEAYGRRNSLQFPLSVDCDQWRQANESSNLSTYVNLSSRRLPEVRPEVGQAGQQPAKTCEPFAGEQEYRRLVRNNQEELYGNQPRLRAPPEALRPSLRSFAGMSEEQMHYMSAARRLQQSIAECEICRQELEGQQQQVFVQQLQSEPACSCRPAAPPPRVEQLAAGSFAAECSSRSLLQPQNDLSLSSKSYHTASSSMLPNNSSLQQLPAGSALEVMPLKHVAYSAAGDKNSSMSNFLLDNNSSLLERPESQHQPASNNIDSSLSSLFVYRHVSDNDNLEFDPDSLEISKTDARGLERAPRQPRQARSSGNWLKPRPKSEYISLSSTTSNGSGKPAAARAAAGQPESSRSRPKAQAGIMQVQVGSDLTQSSLARRRLSNQLNQNASSAKKKLLASKAASRSSPNVSQQQTQLQQVAPASESAARSSNVKNLYQSFKSLLDLSSKSSARQLGGDHSAKLKHSTSCASLPAKSSSLPSRPSKALKMEELRGELAKREQELLTVGAKMKALEDQQRDSQRHIRLLKESLVAKEEHYNLLLADVEELRRNLDERNKLIEKKSFAQQYQQQTARGNPGKSYQEVAELEGMLELKERKIGELQRRLLQLDSLLGERDGQLERARLRLEHSAAFGAGSGGQQQADYSLLSHLEESLADREKQMAMLREQRDRAEHELEDERKSHERTVKEYKMKLKFEMDKFQNRMGAKSTAFDEYSSGGFASGKQEQSGQLKRLELDKRSLQLEVERLKDKLECLAGAGFSRSAALRQASSGERASSAIGDYSVVEFERLQELLEQHKQELRRAQAECRMNDQERKRAQEEADKLSERYERCQSEMHKLKAKLENAISEREQLIEECDRQQQLINKSQTERDAALADINQLKMENERMRDSFNTSQLQQERLQAQLERAQMELKKCEVRLEEQSNELRQVQSERSSHQRELKTIEINLQSAQLQQQRFQQDKELARGELEKLREKYDRLEGELERLARDKEIGQQQVSMFKERLEQQQQHQSKLTKEREQLLMEQQELREKLHKQLKLQDSTEHETRNELRMFKEKYERLLNQFDKLQDDLAQKSKESQMVMEKLQKFQSEAVRLESKLEQSEMDRERMCIEVEKLQQFNSRSKEDFKKYQDELEQLQEMYTKTNTKLLKLNEVEEKLRIDYDKCQMDLEVLRERYEKLQLENRKLQGERDRLQIEMERSEQQMSQQAGLQHQASEAARQGQAGQQQLEDLQRLSSELDRSMAKLEQYQREINKLQLEKERLILDSKSAIQQCEQQFQQQLLKYKTNEEKMSMEMERMRLQAEKVQVKYEQLVMDQDKLVATRESLQQQLLSLQQEVDKFRNQQSSCVQETKKLHDDEMQRILQELETVREKYTQQRKELLQLRELQQNHEIDKDILRRELESAESRLEKINQNEGKQKQDSERCMIEIEKLKDKIERKQQELLRTQKERNQFAQEITNLHQQLQQLQLAVEQAEQQKQQQQSSQGQPSAPPSGQQQVKPEEVNKLKQMLVKSENELQKIMAENQRFQMEVERLKLQLDDAAEYIGKIESDNKLLQKQNQEIIQQMKQQQQSSQASGQQQPGSGNAPKELEMAQQEMKKMQDVIKKSAAEIQKLVDERAKLEERNKELQRQMEETKREFSSALEQYDAEVQRLQQENKRQQQREQPQQAGEEYRIKFEKAVEAIRAFQKSTDDMKKEICRLQERNKSVLDQNQNLIQRLKAAEESASKQASSGAENQAQEAPNNKESQEMRQQLVQLSEVCAKLERELGKSQEEVQEHKRFGQQLKQALEKTQSDSKNVETERDRLQKQLEKLLVELERGEVDKGNLQQMEKSAQELEAKQKELLAHQKQLEERERTLEAKREELQSLSKQIQQQQASSGAAGNQQQLEQMVAKLQQQIKLLEEENGKLRKEIEKLRSELKQAQVEPERLLKILTACEEDKFNMTQQIEQLQAKLKSLQQAPQQQAQQAAGRAPPPPAPQQAGQPRAPAPQQQQQKQQQARVRPQQPPAGQQRTPPPPAQQQQQKQPQQQQQQKPANQGQRPSGPGGFISGFFQ